MKQKLASVALFVAALGIHKVAQRSRAMGSTLVVAIAPAVFEIDPQENPYLALNPALATVPWDWGYPERRLGHFLDSAGIPALSLAPALRSHHATTGVLGYYPWDGHWNAEGHAIVAEALTPFLESVLRGAE